MLKGWDKNIFFYQVGSYKKRKPLPLLPLFQSIFKLSQCWLLLILWSHHSLHSVSNTDTLEVFLLWKKTPTNIPNSAYSNSCWRRTVICPALIILLLCFIVFCLKKMLDLQLYNCWVAFTTGKLFYASWPVKVSAGQNEPWRLSFETECHLHSQLPLSIRKYVTILQQASGSHDFW